MQNNVVLELLVKVLASYFRERSGPMFCWRSRPMKALIDLADKEAIRDTAG